MCALFGFPRESHTLCGYITAVVRTSFSIRDLKASPCRTVTVVLGYLPSSPVTKSPFAQLRSVISVLDISKYQSLWGVKRSLLTLLSHCNWLVFSFFSVCRSSSGPTYNYLYGTQESFKFTLFIRGELPRSLRFAFPDISERALNVANTKWTLFSVI